MTRSSSRIPVEPLAERDWERIREEVFAQLDAGERESPALRGPVAPKFGRAYQLAAACAVVAVISVLVLSTRSSDVGDATSIPARIVTLGDLTRATIGDVTLEVAPDSELSTTGNEASGFVVLLERGRVTFGVPERLDRAPFRVQAGDVQVEVVGTRFTVVRAEESVRVNVARGAVRVTSRGETALLGAGQAWQRRFGADALSERAPAGAPPAVARAPQTTDSPAQADAPASLSAPNAGSQNDAPSATAAQDTRRAPAEGKAATPSARDRYETAAKLEAQDPPRAVALYLELARESHAWSANALYAAARLELERGHKGAARRLFESYLKRFPDGPNATEARALLERAN